MKLYLCAACGAEPATVNFRECWSLAVTLRFSAGVKDSPAIVLSMHENVLHQLLLDCLHMHALLYVVNTSSSFHAKLQIMQVLRPGQPQSLCGMLAQRVQR